MDGERKRVRYSFGLKETGQLKGTSESHSSCQSFFKTGHSRHLFLYFRLFYINVQLVDKVLPMLGFELRISGVGSNSSTN